MAYCKAMFERHKTVPAVPSWAILDSQYLRKYMLAGTMPGSKKPQRWYDEGYLRKGDTIEELAAQLHMKPETLRATVDRFNGFVAKGKDEDFGRGMRAYDRWLGDPYHKPSATLGSISEGPFYAVPVVPGDVGTYGGVVTDEFAGCCARTARSFPVSMRPASRRPRSWDASIRVPAAASGLRLPSATSPRSMPPQVPLGVPRNRIG